MSEIFQEDAGKLGLPISAEIAALPLRILLVEDNQNMAEWVKKHIDPIREELPHAKIEIVHNWRDAHKIIFTGEPQHVVCLDLILPKDGSPDSEWMKWEETVDWVPHIEARSAVIVITGKDPDVVMERLLNKEVEVIMKGPDLFERFFLIRKIVKTFLRWKRTRSDENMAEITSTFARLEKKYAAPAESRSMV